MQTSLFDYILPPDRIAQTPLEPRDQAKLLVLDRENGALSDQHIFDLPDLLQAGDLLVFNDSKVFKARLLAKNYAGRDIEVFLLHPEPGTRWQALIKPGKQVQPGDKLTFPDGSSMMLIEKSPDGTVTLDTHRPADDVFAFADQFGSVPVPPYVKNEDISAERYQTIYAREVGSVAAPTAGFHFTPGLLARLNAKGIKTAFVTLHVGLGTFRPMKTDTLEEHDMHSEWIHVPTETVDQISATKQQNGRVIAVGTTSVRALESAAQSGTLQTFSGFTRLFITPGYTFHVINGLLTNFHLPKSTLLVLVSSFANRDAILNAYQHAIDNHYRFYSFGDAMLIL